MKILKIYDPAMCCSSGVCGPDVDPQLVRLSNFLKGLDDDQVKVERYNLSQEPSAYTAGPVAAALQTRGTDALPLVMIDGEVVSMGEYPELEKLSERLDAAGDTSGVSLDMPDCSGCSGCN